MAGRRGLNGKQRLVDAAFELFARQGFERTTSRQIAARAGVALGLIHRHFGGVEGLMRATDRRCVDWTERRMGRALPLLGQLRGTPQQPDAQDEIALSYVKAALLSDRPGAADLYFALLATGTRSCEDLQRDGILRRDFSPEAVAQFLLITELGGLAAQPLHAAGRSGERRRPALLRHEVMALMGEALRPRRD